MSTTTPPKQPKSKFLTRAHVEAALKVLATPLLSLLVGYLATLVARYFPGTHVNQSQLVWVFIVALASTVLLTLKWLDRLPIVKTLEANILPVLSNVPMLPEEIVKLIEEFGPKVLTPTVKLLESKVAPAHSGTPIAVEPAPSAAPSTTPTGVAVLDPGMAAYIDAAVQRAIAAMQTPAVAPAVNG